MQSTTNRALLSYLPVGEPKPDAIRNSMGYPPCLSRDLTPYGPRGQREDLAKLHAVSAVPCVNSILSPMPVGSSCLPVQTPLHALPEQVRLTRSGIDDSASRPISTLQLF